MNIFGFEISRQKHDVQKAKVAMPTEGQGYIGTRINSGIVDEEFLQELVWPAAGKVYQEMASNDAIIGASLYLLETLIRSTTWKVKPGGTTPQDAEAALFLESCMHDMEETWDEFISEVLSMLTYGFSFHEIVYKVRRGPLEKKPSFQSKFTDGRIGWRSLPARSQATMDSWVTDDRGRAIAFVQDPSLVGVQGDRVELSIADNLLFRTKSVRGNPEGWSLLRRCYRSWYFKRYIEELEGIGIERSMVGIPVLAPPSSVPIFDKNNPEMVSLSKWAVDLVAGLRQDANHGVVLPSTDWELDFKGPSSAKSIDTDKIITRHESRIAMALLSDLIMLGDSGSGSFALSETKERLLAKSIKAIVGGISAVLNKQAVPKLFALNNWALEVYPEITTSDVIQPTLKEVALMLRAGGLDITSNLQLYNYIMAIMEAPLATNETDMAGLVKTAGGSGESFQDTIDNDTKMADMDYTE